MKHGLTRDELNACCSALHDSDAAFKCDCPADSHEGQMVCTVGRGANLFKARFSAKLRMVALEKLDVYVPDAHVFARILGLPGAETLPDELLEVASLNK